MTEQEKVVVRALRDAAKHALGGWKSYALSGCKDREQFAEMDPDQHMRMCRVEVALDTSVIVISEEALS